MDQRANDTTEVRWDFPEEKAVVVPVVFVAVVVVVVVVVVVIVVVVVVVAVVARCHFQILKEKGHLFFTFQYNKVNKQDF
jgi:hypothetical protein